MMAGKMLFWQFRKIWMISGFPGGPDSKESARNAGVLNLVPGPGRSPGKGNGNPLQYSCLENPTDRGAWWAIVHRIAKRQSGYTFFFSMDDFRK